MRKILLFFVGFIFLLFFFSTKNSTFAATCSSFGATCTPSSVCGAEGGTVISGATGCTTASPVCCQFNACQTSADCSSLGKQCGSFTNNCNKTITCTNTCTGTQACTNNKCVSYTCTSPNFCASSAGCIAANDLQTVPGYTCAPGSVCCTSLPPPPSGGGYDCLSSGCAFHSGSGTGTYSDLATCNRDCTNGLNGGQCPKCANTVDPTSKAYYVWGPDPKDASKYTCVNDYSQTETPAYSTCTSPQICYNGQGCGYSYDTGAGFTTGQLPCPNGFCNTAIGAIKFNPTDLVKVFFGIILSIAGALAVILIIISGYRLTASQGNPEAIQGAREQLIAAIVGLLFVILSFTILRLIGISILNLAGQ